MSDRATALALAPDPEGGKPARILEAARQVFMAEGYGEANMDAIAKAAGVSKATVYAHFSGKDQLFAAIIGQQCKLHSEALAVANFEAMSPEAALKMIGRAFADHVLSPQVLGLYRIVVAETARFPELGRALYENGPMRALARLGDYLQRLNDRGLLDIPEPHIAGRQFFGMIRSDFYLRRLFGISDAVVGITVEQMVDRSVEMFLRAYAKHS